MARPKVDIRDKVQKEFPEFTGVVDGLSIDQLNEKIATYAKEADKIEEAKKADEALNEAKEQAAELAAPYRDAIKAIKMKIKYMIALIEDKGGA